MTANSTGDIDFHATTAKRDGHYADVNGVHLYYEIHGAGRPLVLLHGGFGAVEMFGANLASLAAHRQVIAVDLQGHGRTADIDRPIALELMADDIAALIRYLGITRADIMGYSMGGGVALQVAIRHPNLVDKLVLVSTPYSSRGFYPDILAQQAQLGEGAAEFMKQTPMYQLYSAVAPHVEYWPKFVGKMGTAIRAEYDYSNDISRMTATTLLVAGDADIFPASHAVEFFGFLGGGKRDGGWDGAGRPTSSLAILPGLTHYNIFDAPALVATALPFLDQPARPA